MGSLHMIGSVAADLITPSALLLPCGFWGSGGRWGVSRYSLGQHLGTRCCALDCRCGICRGSGLVFRY